MAGKQTTVAACVKEKQNGFVRVFDASLCRHVIATEVHGKIHVFVGNERKSILRCPGTPRTFELSKDQDDQWQIWVATHGGCVYRKCLSFDSANSFACRDGTELVENGNENNQSIFDDLLCDTDPAFEECSKPLEDICEIHEEDKVISRCGEVNSICCGKTFLALHCVVNGETTILIYQRRDPQVSVSDNYVQKLSLPLYESPKDRNYICHLSKSVVVTADCVQYSSSSQINIPSHLFSSLFGWESSVRCLPVLVCCMTDGSVFFSPVDLTASNPESSWQLLCAVDSPVVDIIPVKLNRELSEKESMAVGLHQALGMSSRTPSVSLLDAVIVVGASGKCCVFTAMPALGSAAFSADYHRLVTMFTLPSKVSCVCNGDQSLIVCTGKSIHRHSLTLLREEGSERKYRVKVGSQHLSSALVSSMWFSEQEGVLHYETANGDFVEHVCPVTAADAHSSSNLPQPSQKELLLGVDINQSKMNELSCKQEQLNAFLQQINVASHMLHLSYQSKPDIQSTAPISCSITVHSDVGYRVLEYCVVVLVNNNSSVTLTKDWSVVITLQEMYHSPVDSKQPKLGQNEEPMSHTYCLTQELKAGGQTCFRLPLTYSQTCCGLKINVALMLHVPKTLQLDYENFGVLKESLTVPVSASVLDIFHFLLLKQPEYVPPKHTDPLSFVEQRVAELRNCGRSRFEMEKKHTSQVYSTSDCVSVSAENSDSPMPVKVLRSLVRNSQVNVDLLTQPSCTLQAPCAAVLTVSVELMPQPATVSAVEDGEKIFVVVLKSSEISLLARARLAVSRTLQKIGRKTRNMTSEDFQRIIHKTEMLQQLLQGLQDEIATEDCKSVVETPKKFFAVYEMMQTNIE